MIRKEVGDLALGMYISRLDRPWLESPFLFQGFLLERQEDLDTIREICRFVDVDPELSRIDVQGPVSHKPSPAQPKEAAQPTSRLKDTRLNPQRIIATLEQQRENRIRTHDYLKQLFTDIRMGHSVDSEEAKEFVGTLVDAITDYPDVVVWLTQMKNRDEYTSLHCLNVCVLTLAFCHHLGYGDEDLKAIGMGALLHDIGKAEIPEAVLNKPDRLTPEEWKIMRQHPEIGYRMMRGSGQIPDVALAIIRGHHRRVNGAGYPEAFPQDELSRPVLAAAIADVYDAMTSDRPYHRGLAADQVLRTMQRHGKDTFGQDLMDEFIRCVGIFPVGSVVELVNGSIALVISAGRSARLLPQVLLLRDTKGHKLEKRKLMDLALAATRQPESGWQIRRVVEPARHQITQRELMLTNDSSVASS